MNLIYRITILCFLFSPTLRLTDEGKIPLATLKKTDGSMVNSSKFTNNGKPMIISFWATWCVPCKKELDAIHKVYPQWQKETGVKLIAISIDDSTRALKVPSMVTAKGWNYDVYIDYKNEFQKAMNVTNVPYTFLVDGSGNIVWKHDSYKEGDENHLLELIKKLETGEKISE